MIGLVLKHVFSGQQNRGGLLSARIQGIDTECLLRDLPMPEQREAYSA